MRSILAASLLLAATVALADPPVITGVSPTSGPATGGTVVHVTGKNLLGFPLACGSFPECSTDAQFGDVWVGPLPDATDTDIFFAAPPHAPGLVDFSFHASGYPTVLAGSFRYDNVDAGWQRVLLPVLANATPGAHGSSWWTEVIFNALQGADIHAICTSPIASPCAGNIHLDPGKDVLLDDASIAAYRGPGFVHIPIASAAGVSIAARVRDLSQAGTDFGTELPVVRDSAFRNRVRLGSVPTDARFRLALRVYSLTGDDTAAKLHIYISGETMTPLVETSIPLANGSTSALPYAPAWTEIALDSAYPQIMTGQRVTVDVQPSNQPIWAFVSITNNETQRVTLVTPQ